MGLQGLNHAVVNANGKLFAVTYPGNRWFDEDVKTHHKKIHETQKKYPKGKPRNNNGVGNRQNRSKMKIKKQKAKIAGLEKILNAHKDDNREDVIPSGNDEDQLDVEKAFGG